MIGIGHKGDLWKPSTQLTSDNELEPAEYEILYENIDCRFHTLRSKERMEIGLGIDMSIDLGAVVVLGENISEMDQYYIWKNLTQDTYWLIFAPVQHQTTPKDRWKAYIRQLKVVDETIREYYGS
jgi:hypothetical protein